MKKHYILPLLLVLFVESVHSQAFLRPYEWKKFKREVFFSTGTTNFLGDLGGRNKKGTDYSPVDLDLNQSRTAFGVGGRYRFHKYLNVVAQLNYLIVKGNDNATKDIYRNNRNLNFKSNVFEFSGRIEAGFQKTRRSGGRYGVQKNYAKTRNISHSIYGFLGIGIFYFDPYGLTADGRWVKLRPLRTEGQGLPEGPKMYKNYSFCIPMGGYYKFTWKKIWSLGIELNYRKTFTDYMDDVGGVYYGKDRIYNYFVSENSSKAADARYMSDPSKGNIYGATLPDSQGNPAQRGDKNKDTYITLQVTAGYIFKQQRKSARLRSKF
ncbi:MAG: hypothetical protein IT236_07560 [Bacteroidia bacterium]|nr:hypothetical protein [Bacteroidia bacterium]